MGATFQTCHSGMRRKAQTRNPFLQHYCGAMDSLMCNCTSKFTRFTRAPE
jgi:hypothetical protein